MTLDDARLGIGRSVIYYNHNWRNKGVIIFVNDSFVFVRYEGDVGSKATPANSLHFSVEVSEV